TNTGELNQNATANRLVSEAVILVAKGFSLAVEGIRLFQKELRDARMLTDSGGLGLTHFYEVLQKIEIATQTPIALLGGQAAIQRVKEAHDALEWAGGAAQGFRDHMAETEKSSQALSETLQGFRGNLDQLITKLETTKGQVAAVTTAQKEAADVWDRQTGAISAQTMAAQEHAMAMEGMSKSMFKIDAQATALEKSIDAAVMQSVTSLDTANQKQVATAASSMAAAQQIGDQTEVAFQSALMHLETETNETITHLQEAARTAQVNLDVWKDVTAEHAKETVADVEQVDGAVKGLTGTFETAGTTYAHMTSAQKQLDQ